MIVQLNVEEGRRVTKGDVLAVLESTDYAADCERARANARLMRERLRELENGNRPEEIKEAEADLKEAEALLPQLEAEYKRNAELRRRSSATQQEFELSESKYLAQIQRVQKLKYAHRLMQLGPRQERIDVARAELAQAEADVTKAEWRLGNCTIRAPITGHNPEKERRGRKHRQPDRLQRQLQPVRHGRLVGPGSRSQHSGARHFGCAASARNAASGPRLIPSGFTMATSIA